MGINPKLAGIHLSTDLRRVCDELSGGVIKSVVADIDSKVCAIGQVEGFGENFEPGAGGDIHSAGDSQVCGETCVVNKLATDAGGTHTSAPAGQLTSGAGYFGNSAACAGCMRSRNSWLCVTPFLFATCEAYIAGIGV